MKARPGLPWPPPLAEVHTLKRSQPPPCPATTAMNKAPGPHMSWPYGFPICGGSGGHRLDHLCLTHCKSVCCRCRQLRYLLAMVRTASRPPRSTSAARCSQPPPTSCGCFDLTMLNVHGPCTLPDYDHRSQYHHDDALHGTAHSMAGWQAKQWSSAKDWHWSCRIWFQTARRSHGPRPPCQTGSRRTCPLWPPIPASCRIRCATQALHLPAPHVRLLLSRDTLDLVTASSDRDPAPDVHVCTSHAGTEDDQGWRAAAVLCRDPSVASPLILGRQSLKCGCAVCCNWPHMWGLL